MNNSKVLISVALALMLVIAGCSADTESKTTTTTTSSSEEIANAKSSETTETPSIGKVTVINKKDSDGDGRYTAFDLQIQANTTLEGADSGDPGEPYYVVQINGKEILRTGDVERGPSTTTVIPLNSTVLGSVESGKLNVSVTLTDHDVLFDDKIQTWSVLVLYDAPKTTTQPSTTQAPTTTTQATTSVSTTQTATATVQTTATQSATTVQTTTVQPTTISTTTRSTTTTPPPSTTTSITPTTTTEEPVDSSPQTSWTVEVVRVVDGDTYEVEFPDGHTENVRLLGVDTPEVHVENTPDEFEGIPTTQDGKDWLRDWGHKASEYARTQVAGETVTIKTDDRADRRGSYGRLLVYVYTDDRKSVNEMLIEQGYARMYDSEFSQRSEFASDEQTAQENHVGLWNYEAPEDGGDGDSGSSSQLVVSNIHADAAGNDHDNLNEEYITFTNKGDDELTLTSWTIEDAVNHEYSVPEFTLGAHESVTLYTGSGTNSASKLYWGSGSAIWNNTGDTIIVTTSSGETVIQKEYNLRVFRSLYRF